MTTIKNSDRECCYTCNRLYYDISKGDCCKMTRQRVNVWDDCKTGGFQHQMTAGE